MQVPKSAIKCYHEHQSGKLCLWLEDGSILGDILKWNIKIHDGVTVRHTE